MYQYEDRTGWKGELVGGGGGGDGSGVFHQEKSPFIISSKKNVLKPENYKLYFFAIPTGDFWFYVYL